MGKTAISKSCKNLKSSSYMCLASLDINLIKANRSVFIRTSLISTDPQLNIVSSGSATIVSVKPW